MIGSPAFPCPDPKLRRRVGRVGAGLRLQSVAATVETVRTGSDSPIMRPIGPRSQQEPGRTSGRSGLASSAFDIAAQGH